MSKCQCDLRTKLVGDGCRYCNAQEYIDKLIESLEELIEAIEEQRTWAGLTDEEIRNLWDGHVIPVFGKNGINPIVFARAIEAAHGIKGEA